MSKIDEILYNLELINGVLDDEEYQLICNCVNKIRAVLEQLRPYVELAEYIIEHIELIKTDWHGASAAEFLKSYRGLILLIKQIKEQSNGM